MIYCVEDDNSIRELVVYTLKNTGFEVCGFDNGKDMLIAAQKKLPKLILLDIMLPGEDGISILKRIRSDALMKKIPVIMVSAKGTEYDKVIGLDMGADDYISKPFGIMELISRIKAVLRRYENEQEDEIYSFENVTLNNNAHIVTVSENEVILTLKEYELLHILMKKAGTVLQRDYLLEKIWGYNFDGETRTVDVHIRTLRSKLGKSGDIIETVRGVGYRIGGNT